MFEYVPSTTPLIHHRPISASMLIFLLDQLCTRCFGSEMLIGLPCTRPVYCLHICLTIVLYYPRVCVFTHSMYYAFPLLLHYVHSKGRFGITRFLFFQCSAVLKME